jgi:hypothetical protein
MTAEAPLARSASRDRDKFRDKESKDKLDAEKDSDSPRVKGEKEGEKEGAGREGEGEKKTWGYDDTEPTEAIVRVLWGDFKAQTKRKIDEVMAFGIVCFFSLLFLNLFFLIFVILG